MKSIDDYVDDLLARWQARTSGFRGGFQNLSSAVLGPVVRPSARPSSACVSSLDALVMIPYTFGGSFDALERSLKRATDFMMLRRASACSSVAARTRRGRRAGLECGHFGRSQIQPGSGRPSNR